MHQSQTLDSLFRLHHAIKRQMHSHVEALALDITPMHLRVMKIIKRKSPCTAIDIAHFLNRDKAQITRLLKPLIEQQLIVKAANPHDKRSQLLEFSEEGEALLGEMSNIEKQLLDTLCKDLSQEQLSQFLTVANIMTENLKN